MLKHCLCLTLCLHLVWGATKIITAGDNENEHVHIKVHVPDVITHHTHVHQKLPKQHYTSHHYAHHQRAVVHHPKRKEKHYSLQHYHKTPVIDLELGTHASPLVEPFLTALHENPDDYATTATMGANYGPVLFGNDISGDSSSIIMPNSGSQQHFQQMTAAAAVVGGGQDIKISPHMPMVKQHQQQQQQQQLIQHQHILSPEIMSATLTGGNDNTYTLTDTAADTDIDVDSDEFYNNELPPTMPGQQDYVPNKYATAVSAMQTLSPPPPRLVRKKKQQQQHRHLHHHHYQKQQKQRKAQKNWKQDMVMESLTLTLQQHQQHLKQQYATQSNNNNNNNYFYNTQKQQPQQLQHYPQQQKYKQQFTQDEYSRTSDDIDAENDSLSSSISSASNENVNEDFEDKSTSNEGGPGGANSHNFNTFNFASSSPMLSFPAAIPPATTRQAMSYHNMYQPTIPTRLKLTQYHPQPVVKQQQHPQLSQHSHQNVLLPNFSSVISSSTQTSTPISGITNVIAASALAANEFDAQMQQHLQKQEQQQQQEHRQQILRPYKKRKAQKIKSIKRQRHRQ